MTRSERRIDRPPLAERPPSGQLHYGAYRGRLRDVRAGAHHGAYCLGCCWSLMALFVVVGVTNLAAMVVLAAVVLAEKLWVHGELLARLVGVAALALAVAVIWVPALAPGLHETSQMMNMAGSYGRGGESRAWAHSHASQDRWRRKAPPRAGCVRLIVTGCRGSSAAHPSRLVVLRG